jgi:hypothetical protein
MAKVLSAATAFGDGSAMAAADAIRKERRVKCMVVSPANSVLFRNPKDRLPLPANPIPLWIDAAPAS